jgi:hypothetical protein
MSINTLVRPVMSNCHNSPVPVVLVAVANEARFTPLINISAPLGPSAVKAIVPLVAVRSISTVSVL